VPVTQGTAADAAPRYAGCLGDYAEATMEQFPERWLLVIGKHLRRHMGLSPDAPLPANVQNSLRRLRDGEIARRAA
jgi:hypothetical protein